MLSFLANSHIPKIDISSAAVRRYAVSEILSRNVMHCPLIPLLFFDFSLTQAGCCKVQAPPRLLQDLSPRSWQVWESVTLSGFSGLIEYAPCLLLIDDSARGAEIRSAALAGPADGWTLEAPGVTETLQICRASVMKRRGWPICRPSVTRYIFC